MGLGRQVEQVGFVRRAGALILLASFVFAGCRQADAPTAPAIRLEIPVGERASVIVEGIAREEWQALAGLADDDWPNVLRVTVGENQPPMLGTYSVGNGSARFTPMFPLDPGRPYYVVYDAAKIPNNSARAAAVRAAVSLPAANIEPSTMVSHVYPSGEVIPENQLRFYIQFSAPMGLKGGLDYVTLLDERGKPVEDPFLPLDAEFWNDDRTRYTVFFDPGRQKRGILPNKEMGRSLIAGRRYTLVVDRGWRDGAGLPLKETFRRQFRVGPADETALVPADWQIGGATAGTKSSLVVRFQEPMDHGLLRRALAVSRDGQPVVGDVQIEEQETRWRFTPREDWKQGTYQLVALGMLEDLAGNRIGRAFEVDQFDRADRSAEPERTLIPFIVLPRP